MHIPPPSSTCSSSETSNTCTAGAFMPSQQKNNIADYHQTVVQHSDKPIHIPSSSSECACSEASNTACTCRDGASIPDRKNNLTSEISINILLKIILLFQKPVHIPPSSSKCVFSGTFTTFLGSLTPVYKHHFVIIESQVSSGYHEVICYKT